MTPTQRAALMHTLLQLAISAGIIFLEAIGTLLLAPGASDLKFILIQGGTLAIFSFINGALHYLKINDPQFATEIAVVQPLVTKEEEQFWKDIGAKGTLPTGSTGIIAAIPGNAPAVQLPPLPKTS